MDKDPEEITRMLKQSGFADPDDGTVAMFPGTVDPVWVPAGVLADWIIAWTRLE